MTLVLEKEGKLYAQLVNPFDVEQNKSFWVGKQYEPLQGSVMRYDEKIFRNHRHILNPRIIKRTQEAFVVVLGKVTVKVFDEKTREFIGQLSAVTGQAIFVWDGFHEISFDLKDTIAYEIKAGQFTSIQEDKEFYDTSV